MIETEIVIVGCGPVGALMANLLGARGIRTLVLEKDLEIYQLPRAVGMDDEVMRVLQSQKLDAAYKENVFTLRGMDLLRGNRRRLRRFSLEEESRSLGHSILTLFHQPTLEKEIRAGLDRYPDNVDLRLGHEVHSIQDVGDRVELTFADAETGREETVRACYVLGCDGSRSTVRKMFDVEQEDLGLHQPWVVVDVIMKRPIEASGFAEQMCDPARPGTFIPSPPPRNRWEFMLMPGDDPDHMLTPGALKELIKPWASPEDYEVERAAIYTFHTLIAKSWRMGRSGNVLLLGDAAHQMPPFLGQGMCAGVRDAFNLAWKLDLVLRGDANADILDSYQSERAKHVHRVIKLVVKIGKLIQSSSRIKSFFVNASMVIGERLGLAPPLKTMKTVPLGAGFYSKNYAPGAHLQCPFPQPNVEDSSGKVRLFDTFLGNDFTLLTREGMATYESESGGDSRIQQLGFRPAGAAESGNATPSVVDTEGVIGLWMDEHNCDAVLLRPDRQPFGVYRGSDASFATIRDDLRGALGSVNQPHDGVLQEASTMEGTVA